METSKRYRVVVSERAAQMLACHAGFLAKVSEAAAEKLVQAFEAAAATLEEQPHRTPYLTTPMLPQSSYHKLLLAKRYMLIYKVADQTVMIDYVVDCRQEWQWLLK